MSETGSITVIGSNGLLGSVLARVAGERGREVVPLARSDIDLADIDFLTEWVPETDWVVNCAAVNDVDGCEDEKAKDSLLVNGVAPELLAAACRRHGKGFVHISTDYVFYGDGLGSGEDGQYDESDETSPRSRYACHKLMGEVGAVSNGAYALRTAWLYGPGGKNFICKSYELCLQRKPLKVDAVSSSTPTSAANLAEYILVVIDTDERDSGYLYHCCDEGETTRFSVFERVRTAMGVPAEKWPLEKGPLFVGRAPRPTRSPLDSSAFFMRFGNAEQRTVKDSVREFVEQCREHFGVQVQDGSVI